MDVMNRRRIRGGSCAEVDGRGPTGRSELTARRPVDREGKDIPASPTLSTRLSEPFERVAIARVQQPVNHSRAVGSGFDPAGTPRSAVRVGRWSIRAAPVVATAASIAVPRVAEACRLRSGAAGPERPRRFPQTGHDEQHARDDDERGGDQVGRALPGSRARSHYQRPTGHVFLRRSGRERRLVPGK